MAKITKIAAFFILGIMFILMFFSAWNESATFDEVAHIPAGYSYLTQQDYRINPEHPPLVKDISAVPLLFLNLNFKTDTPVWTELINGRQWDMGKIFLYESDNDPDKIIRFSRFPIMILAIIFGWLIFKWASKYYGNKVGLLTLFFYAMSPTIIAHSRYVTTDIGAAFGIFLALTSFINFLCNQNKKNLILAGIAFGICQLIKFSAIILIPTYFVLAILWVILENYSESKKIIRESFKIIGKLIILGVISILVVWPNYQFHVWNYPVERQISDIRHILSSDKAKVYGDIAAKISELPLMQGLGEYVFGVFMVIRRAATGNSAYFMGEVSASAWPSYFPVLYATKENIGFHILTLIAIIFSIKNIIDSEEKKLKAVAEWMKDNFAITASIVFISIYLLQAITGNLNIGIRHILPALPFIYFLVARQIIRWIRNTDIEQPRNVSEWISYIYHKFIKSLERYVILITTILLIFLTTIFAFPYYLSYYNIFGGNTENGYKIATDSNYDWGQDLKRLKDWVQKNKIEKIKLDYFGGGRPEYYLGEKFEPWWSSKDTPPENSWLAVSINQLQGAQAKQIKGFYIKPEDTYSWLKNKEPVARAGTSIFIYKF